MGLLRRPTPGEIVEDGRLGRPCGPGAHSRVLAENQLRLRRHSRIRTSVVPAAYRELIEQRQFLGSDHRMGCCVPDLAFLSGAASIRQAVDEEGSMRSDHDFTPTDGPSSPTAAPNLEPGEVPQLQVGATTAGRWTTTSAAGQCAGRPGSRACDG